MSEKPGKRLVSKRLYFRLLGKRITYLSIVAVALSLGILFFALPWRSHETHAGAVILCVAYAVGMFSIAFCFGRAERKIEKVKLIMGPDQHLLPPKDTLVRPSDLPPSHQQGELLRGAMPGNETAPEELLRASVTRGTGGQDM